MNCKDKKHCSGCGVEKPLGEFHKNSRARDGRHSQCKACVKVYTKNYHQANREHRSEYNREYYWANRGRRLEYEREYRQANKERRLEYIKERRASDPIFALACRCRARIRHALRSRGFSKDSTTAEMLGCAWEEFAAHLESQFVDGMSWDNMSEWHIDHIVPLASASTKEETVALNHYTNLQPLWAEDNLSKGAGLCS